MTVDQGSGSSTDAVSIGLLARAFAADVVDEAIDRAGAPREAEPSAAGAADGLLMSARPSALATIT